MKHPSRFGAAFAVIVNEPSPLQVSATIGGPPGEAGNGAGVDAVSAETGVVGATTGDGVLGGGNDATG